MKKHIGMCKNYSNRNMDYITVIYRSGTEIVDHKYRYIENRFLKQNRLYTSTYRYFEIVELVL